MVTTLLPFAITTTSILTGSKLSQTPIFMSQSRKTRVVAGGVRIIKTSKADTESGEIRTIYG